ncbi:MAG: type IV pilus biogenesis protein PilM [Oscillospiraceae bacterium]
MISIDITDRQIKFVRGQQSGSKVKILDADMRELTMGIVSNGYITDLPMVAAELNDIIKSKGVKEKDVVVSITSSSIVYKEIKVLKPKNMKNPAIIEAMIQSEMGASSDYNISFTVAGEEEDEEHNKLLRVYAAACPQRLVDGYVRLFSHVGLALKQVYISNNSVSRLIKSTAKMADRMPLLLVQIDKNFLNVNLYENNQLSYSRFSNITPSDPNEYGGDGDYLPTAINNNLERMLQFISQRKGSKPLQEILFYGDIDSFIEISNAISSFGIPANMLSMPSSVSTNVQFDFTKFANAVGALFHTNKELEHINLLEATSAKESKGSGGFLLALVGTLLASAAVVGGITLGVGVLKGGIDKKIKEVDARINDPVLKQDMEIVSAREGMLEGFQNYNNTVDKVILQFNYLPKVQSLVFEKVQEPMDKKKGNILKDDELLEIAEISVDDGGGVTVSFRGLSKGNPTDLPSRYANYLTNKVLDKYGEPYFVDVTYTGFTKDNISEYGTMALLSAEEREKYDTYFSFDMSMQVKPGSDELHTDIIKDLGLDKEVTE